MTNILVTINSPELNQAIMSLATAITLKKDQSKIMSEGDRPLDMTVGASEETSNIYTYHKDQNMQDCSIEQLILKPIQLIDAGYRTELADLPANLGVSLFVCLSKEKYAAYAAGLWELGARA